MPGIVDSGIGELLSKALDKIFPDKDAALAAKTQLAQLANQGELNELDDRYKAIIAEAQSSDKWTSRARPSFMYVMYIMILFSIPYGIWYAVHPSSAIQMASGLGAWLKAIPDSMWATFGLAFTGYTVGRSMEKVADIKHVQSKK